MTTPQELQAKLNLGIEKARTNSRLLVLVGACLMLVSLFMSWWSLGKYRVDEQYGHDLMVVGSREKITEKMTPEEVKDYDDRVNRYRSAWSAITERHKDFYVAEFGDGFAATLETEDKVNKGSSYLVLKGISTWTGRFGFLFLIAGVAWYLAPKLKPDLEEYAWTIPWAWTALAAVFLIAALAFYFGVPDIGGEGYSQGITLGWYVSLLGALAIIVGGTFEGIKSANERLAILAARSEEEAVEEAQEVEAEDAAPSPAPRRKEKAPPPVDERAAEEEAKRKRLTDW